MLSYLGLRNVLIYCVLVFNIFQYVKWKDLDYMITKGLSGSYLIERVCITTYHFIKPHFVQDTMLGITVRHWKMGCYLYDDVMAIYVNNIHSLSVQEVSPSYHISERNRYIKKGKESKIESVMLAWGLGQYRTEV